eukprot:3481043-Prymnesium_polylepis.1
MLINDKTDGFLDELLPYVRIVTHQVYAGCVQGLARSALDEVRSASDGIIATFGPACSDDVANLADFEYRRLIASNIVHISHSSTAPTISNTTLYPNVARLSTNDNYGVRAMVEVCNNYKWVTVSVLYDTSKWSREYKDYFCAAFLSRRADDGSTKTADVYLIEDELTFDALELLQRMTASGSKVAVM